MIPQINQMKTMLRGMQNPNVFLEQSPMYKQAKDIVKQYNGDYNKAISDLCSKNGINLNEFMNLFR